MSATVEIVDVKPAAQRVPLHALQVGDIVFDAFGGEHRITDIWITSRREPLVWIMRDDRPRHGECLGLLNDDRTITIIPTLAGRQGNPTQEV